MVVVRESTCVPLLVTMTKTLIQARQGVLLKVLGTVALTIPSFTFSFDDWSGGLVDNVCTTQGPTDWSGLDRSFRYHGRLFCF